MSLQYILIFPEHYSFFFLLQTSSNFTILISSTNALHSQGGCVQLLQNVDACFFDSWFLLYLLNGRLHSYAAASATLIMDKTPSLCNSGTGGPMHHSFLDKSLNLKENLAKQF